MLRSLSILDDSVLAELARSVGSGGPAALSANGAPPIRVGPRTPGEAEAAGTLELRSEDAGEEIVAAAQAETNVAIAIRFHTAHDFALALASRPELIGEASGGVDPSLATTPSSAIDVTKVDVQEGREARDTFTYAPGAGAEERCRPNRPTTA